MSDTATRSERPFLSIVIPALNEADTISGTVGRLRAMDRARQCQVIVVDGDPRGTTIQAIRDEEVITMTSPPGRARQMNLGAARATGEAILFLHADTLLPEDAIQSIRSALHRRKCVAGAFDLGIASDRLVFTVIARFASIRSRITRIPYGDQAIFMTKEYFDSLGGYAEVPWCTYTDPEIAHVGMYESDAAKEGVRADVFVRQLKEVGRAVQDGEEAGFAEAFEALRHHDAVLGPSQDGGYYLIGFVAQALVPEAFEDIEWGSETVMEKTLSLLRTAGLDTYLLPRWKDIDTAQDLLRFAMEHEPSKRGESRTLRFLHEHAEELGLWRRTLE